MTPVVRIPIGDGYVTLIDPADYLLVAGPSWRALRGHNGKVYAYANGGNGAVYVHRLVAGTPKGWETDHINGDGLDNRRANLRVATPAQNSANSGKPRRPDGSSPASAFKGVSWDRSRGMWQAKICLDQIHRNLGRYADEGDAARAYDAAAAEAWPGFARLNFPVVTS